MNAIEFKRLATLLAGLTASECIQAREVLGQRERQVAADVVLREFEGQVKSCPHCHGSELRSAGSKDGRKRFKCVGCSKTFNAYTGTPLARLKMADKHIEHAQLMVEGLSLRKVAEKLMIDLHTAFLWRHRFLQAARDEQPAKLCGVVEADETFFLESLKGQKSGLPRPAKKRGEPAYRTIGKLHGLDVKSVPAKKAAGNYHINNVNAYDSRLKGWMFRFRGVATKYLDNYLGWHRMLDKDGKNASGRTIVSGLLAA